MRQGNKNRRCGQEYLSVQECSTFRRMGKHNSNNLQDCFFFHHLSRERISSQQDFGIKWQHKDLKSNGSTAGRTFLSAAGGFAGQSQPGHLTGTHRRRKSVRFAAAAPPIRYHFRINYLPSFPVARFARKSTTRLLWMSSRICDLR